MKNVVVELKNILRPDSLNTDLVVEVADPGEGEGDGAGTHTVPHPGGTLLQGGTGTGQHKMQR